jgi:hypothetical protein
MTPSGTDLKVFAALAQIHEKGYLRDHLPPFA